MILTKQAMNIFFAALGALLLPLGASWPAAHAAEPAAQSVVGTGTGPAADAGRPLVGMTDTAAYFPLLRGRRVAVLANQTSVAELPGVRGASGAAVTTDGAGRVHLVDLLHESGFDVRKVEVGVDVNLAETAPIEVPKDEGVMARLERFVDAQSPATLSPTAFFRYVACPLRFYFHSIARLEADDEISEEVDAPMFGTILHAAVQTLYARIAGEAKTGCPVSAALAGIEITLEATLA